MNHRIASQAPDTGSRSAFSVIPRFRRWLIRTVLLIALLVLAGPPAAAQNALSVDDVVTILRFRDGPADVLAEVREEMIRDRCVSFRLNQEKTTRLRGAGADARVLAAIRDACYEMTSERSERVARLDRAIARSDSLAAHKRRRGWIGFGVGTGLLSFAALTLSSTDWETFEAVDLLSPEWLAGIVGAGAGLYGVNSFSEARDLNSHARYWRDRRRHLVVITPLLEPWPGSVGFLATLSF
jgi:hypothetical protein